MAFEVRYDVRVLEDGKTVVRKRFKLKDAFVNFVRKQSRAGRKLRVKVDKTFVLETFSNDVWGPPKMPAGPWVKTPGNLKEAFIHHTVTQELPITATVEQEKAHMRLLEAIAIGRGFNGISYSWVVFPSGRCWEGRGWMIQEAATEDHNTSSDSISLAGNKSSFALTELQRLAVEALVNRAQAQGVFVKSGLNVRAHREVSATSCPGTKVSAAQIDAWQQAVNG